MDNVRISRLRAFAARLRGLFDVQKRDNDFGEEVKVHLQLLVDRFVTQGMSREEAAEAVRRQFGNTTILQEDRRERRTFVSVEDLGRDVRYARRSVARRGGVAAVFIPTTASQT